MKRKKRKVLKRTERKGLRRPSFRDNFSFKKVAKWEERFKNLLIEGGEKANGLMEYGTVVCRFRLAVITSQSQDAQFWLREIDRLENKLHTLGFSQDDLWAINRVFRDKAREELEYFVHSLEEKRAK